FRRVLFRSDAAEVLSRQATLIGDSANNCTWTNILALTNVKTVSLKVAIVAALMASTTIVTVETVTATSTTVAVTSASTAIATVITVEAVTTVALRSRHVLDQEVCATLELHC